MVSRRHVLAAMGLGSLATLIAQHGAGHGLLGSAHASRPGTAFTLAALDLGADRNGRALALGTWAMELDKRTAVTASPTIATIGPSWRELRQYPLVVLCGQSPCRTLLPVEVAALGRYLTAGGTIIIDTLEPSLSARFDQSVRELAAQIATPSGGSAFAPIAASHVLYRSFYLLKTPAGRVATTALEGITVGSRLAIIYGRGDLTGALLKTPAGGYALTCEPGGEAQREQAIRLAVNLIMYALCLDYKDDQAHVPGMLGRRRWRANDGATVVP